MRFAAACRDCDTRIVTSGTSVNVHLRYATAIFNSGLHLGSDARWRRERDHVVVDGTLDDAPHQGDSVVCRGCHCQIHGHIQTCWKMKTKGCTEKKVSFVAGLSFFQMCLFFSDVLHAHSFEYLFYSIQQFAANQPSLCSMCFCFFCFFIWWKIHGNHDAFSQYKSSSQQSGGKKSFSLTVMEATSAKCNAHSSSITFASQQMEARCAQRSI